MIETIAGLFGRFRGRDRDCLETRENASSYIEGDLPDSRIERIRNHLRRCGPCMNFVDSLRSTVALLKTVPAQKIDPSLQRSILEKVRGASTGERDSSRKEERE